MEGWEQTNEMVGGGAVLGTLIGAIAGGGKGAAIGAVARAGAGAGTQVLTRGKTVKVPAETAAERRRNVVCAEPPVVVNGAVMLFVCLSRRRS